MDKALQGSRGLGCGGTLALLLSLTACTQPEPVPTPEPVFKVMSTHQGCQLEQLTDENFDSYQFQGVSRDGRWLSVAWSKGEDANGNPLRGSYLLNLTTGEKTPLPAMINNVGSFSADGGWLVGAHYVSSDNTEIMEHHLASGVTTLVSPHATYDFLPSFAPDGQHLLFNASRSGNSEVYLYNRQSKALTRLTDNTAYDAHGEFSPDGKKILFHRMLRDKNEEGRYDFDLFVYDIATNKETQLTSIPYENSYGSWGPDNETVVFSSDVDEKPEKHNLYLRRPNGDIVQLTDGDWKDSYSYWSRDGSFIYFNSDRGGVTHIYRVRMNGLNCE